jgi:5,10-methylene-tetrahydrofolate dehydrogenase/methenyl tetrahydrofolate cyclohydrolase
LRSPGSARAGVAQILVVTRDGQVALRVENHLVVGEVGRLVVNDRGVVSAGSTWQGKKLIPDVDESVGGVASWITPRLGVASVTTVALLLENTLTLAEAATR